MYYSGFADEVAGDIETQIRVTKALGWKHIELRRAGSANLIDIPEQEFEAVCEKLTQAGMSVNSFGSPLAKRGSKEGVDEFEESISDLKRALPRMKKLGTKLIRGMSFKVPGPGDWFGSDFEKNTFKALRKLATLCEEAGVIYIHENCDGYGGLSYEHSLKMLEAVKSPAFKLVFDSGNPLHHEHRVGEPPYRKQSSWEFFKAVESQVVHFHAKDAKAGVHCFPGEGEGEIKKIVKELLKSGYEGGYSIEPHMKPEQMEGLALKYPYESLAFNLYFEYGTRFVKLVEGVKQELSKAASH